MLGGADPVDVVLRVSVLVAALQFLVILFFSYYGEMSVAISPNPQLAAIMSSAVYSIWFIFAGKHPSHGSYDDCQQYCT
jgi:hypothetical protein